MVPHIAVIGGGVIGLSTALNIQINIPGARVKVIAERFDVDTTSYGSGGIWLPTMTWNNTEKQIRQWCRGSWDFYSQLATGAEAGRSGACISNGYILYRNTHPEQLFQDYVFSYRKLGTEEMKRYNFPPEYRYGYNATTVIIDQRKYLKWLMDRIAEKGGEFEKREVVDLSEFAGSQAIVVNCTGLGSRELVGDQEIYAIRGQVLQVKAPWMKNWICNTESDKGFSTFIIPGENVVTLAGTAQLRDESLDPRSEDSEDVMRRCTALFPSLKTAEIERVWVGLRPRRDAVRLEAEDMQFGKQQLKVVHNYGHGADGVALAWGSAKEAADLVRHTLSTRQAKL